MNKQKTYNSKFFKELKVKYESMIHFAFREEQRFEKEAENFQKLFEEIRNDLKNCTFTPDRFRLIVYKIFSAIFNGF